MSIFRRSLMQSDRPIRTYKAKFQMKFDPETYGTDNYALTVEALEKDGNGYTGYGQVLNYGLGFTITYGSYTISTPASGVFQNYIKIQDELTTRLTVSLKIKNETTGKTAVYNDFLEKTVIENVTTSVVGNKGLIGVKLIHDPNDETFELENTSYDDTEYGGAYGGASVQHTAYAGTGTATVGRVDTTSGLLNTGPVTKLLIKSKCNLLTNNEPTIFTVEVVLKSSQSFAKDSFILWNTGCSDSVSTGAKASNNYFARCNCKYGELEADSIFIDNRFEGVE